MLRFSFLGFPVGIDPFFWVTAVLLGGGLYARTPEEWINIAVWVVVVFFSILVHEIGHALAGRRFGASPAIKLHGFGGVTFLPGGQFTRKESILVSAAGPAAGLCLGLLLLLLRWVIPGEETPLLYYFFLFGLYVNFFWTGVNLIPIQPLDGGQILREFLGPERRHIASGIGFFLAVIVAVWAFREGQIFLAVLMGVFAYYNIQREPTEGGVVKG